MTDVVQVDFSKPIALFPLSGAVLLPHALQPLHIFEPRYRQMVNDCLDHSGQIAMAVPTCPKCTDIVEDAPWLRPVVCVGQIIQHESLDDGRHNILLHGVCRARIQDVLEPDDERLYCLGQLQPLETQDGEGSMLDDLRTELQDLLAGPRLKRMRSVSTVMDWFDRDDIPTQALIELIGFVLLRDCETKYRLLAEPNVTRRADVLVRELRHLDGLVAAADRQGSCRWPKGMSWN